jgi:hypothetical protein
MMAKLTQYEIGFRLGVAISIGCLVHTYDHMAAADELRTSCGLTTAKLKAAGATEFDLRAMRRLEAAARRYEPKTGRSSKPPRTRPTRKI